MDKGILATVALVLVLIGALNWGLVGLLDFNLVAKLLGSLPYVERAVYIIVGVAAVFYAFVTFAGNK